MTKYVIKYLEKLSSDTLRNKLLFRGIGRKWLNAVVAEEKLELGLDMLD